jgi:hypothetical protein
MDPPSQNAAVSESATEAQPTLQVMNSGNILGMTPPTVTAEGFQAMRASPNVTPSGPQSSQSQKHLLNDTATPALRSRLAEATVQCLPDPMDQEESQRKAHLLAKRLGLDTEVHEMRRAESAKLIPRVMDADDNKLELGEVGEITAWKELAWMAQEL